ncbi:MAG: YwiC-like family protein [Chloroflexi bacterium]|nr:YwiC-like family protein [Chloroflexota bacterium]
MTSSPTTTQKPPNTRIKSVVIPPEHGAWGFLLEPVVLGLGIAPSWAGLFMALGVVGAFLTRHPLKIALLDRTRGKRYARTRLAERFALVYGAVALAGFVPAVVLVGLAPFAPFGLALPLVVILFASFRSNRWRSLLPELAGASAMAATAASIALAGSEGWNAALASWAVLLARNIPSIMYIRARLRLEKGQPHSAPLVLGINGIAVAGIFGLVVAGYAPLLAVAAMALLFVRAAAGLSPYRRQVQTKTLGFLEIGYGLLVVTLTIVGYTLG